MGEVKDEIHGAAPKHKAKVANATNITQTVKTLKDEISELTAIKDEDVQKEGPAAKAENLRKAGVLRAVHSLLSSAESMLSGY